MKKFLCACFMLCFGVSFVFSQSNPTIDDVFKVLNEDFQKHEWVHQLLAQKTEDTRPNLVKMYRMPYEMTIEENGEEKKTTGENLIIQIIKGGYRYDLKLDFSPKKEKGAERSRTVKNRIYKNILTEILPKETATTANAE